MILQVKFKILQVRLDITGKIADFKDISKNTTR